MLERVPKLGRTGIVLIVALGVGVLSALSARYYFKARIAAIDAEANQRVVSVVVAKTALHKGDVLSRKTLAVRSIPRQYAHLTAVSPDEFQHIDGERIAYDLEAGEAVLWGLLESKRAPTFSARIAEGRRAVTVPVDEINSISGLLEPGDTIDLIVSFEQQGKVRAVPLLQGVKVMATGQRSVDDPKTGEAREYETVTLDTTPEEARAVILAREGGHITALLRNPDDVPGPSSSSDLNAWLYGKPAAAGRSNSVPVLYGGGASLSSSALNAGVPDASEKGASHPEAAKP
ncbi:pilus assembly protein CpaB [Solimonas aquatica]|uniref:Pilus assembly protein CpaB n=1 Tax=Solimonas aquatica TaxID=489703 RepID=A0A1H9MK45_9GAMM|nr:pilus assembly protein CpaB [Solimonas aquatica]